MENKARDASFSLARTTNNQLLIIIFLLLSDRKETMFVYNQKRNLLRKKTLCKLTCLKFYVTDCKSVPIEGGSSRVNHYGLRLSTVGLLLSDCHQLSLLKSISLILVTCRNIKLMLILESMQMFVLCLRNRFVSRVFCIFIANI